MSILLADIDATCAALGYSDGNKYLAEPDAIQGLKHIIWILRRDLDNHEYRRHLGRAKVLQTDLVPMLPDYIEDDEFADVLIRLLVILTNPTLLLYRDGAPKDNHGRKVFMELIDILQGYKSAFTSSKTWAALTLKTQKSLEIDWALRSEEQGLMIERVLVLIRNVLQVPANPEAECRADNDASLHDQVIWALHQSGILDLVLYVVSSPDENQYHLHGLEILCLLFREQTAESLADASLQRSASEKQRDEQELIAARRREKQKLVARPPAGRHSRFGGTYVIQNFRSVSDKDAICHQSLERAVAIDFDREKERQKKSHRIIKEESQSVRRSAFSVRLCLREFCIEVLRSAYNTLVRQVRRVLERNSGSTSHDDSYLLWAVKFFMEFNRLSGLQMHLVSESLSVQCFHWVLTRMQHDMDMMTTDKKQARLWAKRLHVALQTFRELIFSLLALQKLQDDKAKALFDMLLNNVCYVLEYRETILHLLMNYNEAHSTKIYLRDVIETANIFLKMMEKFCKDSVVVQDKHRRKNKKASKKKSQKPTPQETEEQLENKWVEIASQLSEILSNELNIPEEDQPIPFDAASDKSIDDQKEDCMVRIHKLLREEKLEHAISLMRSAREVWPENDCFGAMTAAPEDELLLLREIFLYNIGSDEQTQPDENEEDSYDEEEYEEGGNSNVVEKTFKFEDFEKRLLNPKIIRACSIVLADWEKISTKSLKSIVTILYRIAYGCKCPAMLYQAYLFRIFQQVFDAPRDPHWEELRRLGIYVIRKFVETAPKNPKIYAELFFYKSIRDANELETGYCDVYESGTKGTWTEEQESELRFLFEENQNNPQTDQDVIDWILENLIDKTRTRRGVLKKLREMGLQFKAPTKKSTAAMANKDLWQREEDDELKGLFDEHRLDEDCLQKIMDVFGERRSKNHIIKRMIQLHLIADKSEILPAKTTKKKKSKSNVEGEEEGHRSKTSSKSKKSPQKQPNRTIIRTPLDVGTIRSLMENVDSNFADALEWLKESFADAAEDSETPSEEDDGVPLLPLLEIQKEAMEDDNFKKLLLALGAQPPLESMENYWRIPTYLNASDLKLRERILGCEEIDENELNLGDEEEEDDENDNEQDNEGGGESGEESEEDYLDTFMSKKREQMNSLIYNKSDNEDEQRAPLTPKKKTSSKRSKDKNTSSKKDQAENLFDMVKSNEENDDKSDDEGNFNSENYRKRLAELASSDSESDNEANATVIENTNTSNRSRIRHNRIDSDSEEETAQNKNESSGGRKRPRSSDEENDPNNESTSKNLNDSDDDDELFIKRKNLPSTKTKLGEEPKRRRIAVIDDDDEDDQPEF
ncbi:protein timeless homolog [Episyrphus balteatus]|uniref:protein timeless homolog n=1 Tax=Episyrphus balteatus TaxID=286459 RepID=UPI0024860848|nr:protein timeless homolog [Episyrphus balteatus]